jgi:GNAT superfamily N-acetyltransferase
VPPLITIRGATFDEVAPLFAELDVDLTRRYGPGEPVHVDRAQFDLPGGALLVAVELAAAAEDRATSLLGCVGVRHLPRPTGVDLVTGPIAELKRMYVRPAVRRRGLAKTLLTAAEATARELGYEHLWLETGLRQPAAVDLYRAAGYTPVRSVRARVRERLPRAPARRRNWSARSQRDGRQLLAEEWCCSSSRGSTGVVSAVSFFAKFDSGPAVSPKATSAAMRSGWTWSRRASPITRGTPAVRL